MTWVIGLAAAAVGLYGLHRLAVRLEKSGWIRYRNAAPDGGAAGGALFAELHKIYEPSVKHVYELRDERRPRREADAGDPPDDPGAQRPPVPPGERPENGVS
jgi:hypothetical protein